jgi:Bacteriocin-protection, YdeI or OmpD-Associated/Domain of unknown function (DUF1905)
MKLRKLQKTKSTIRFSAKLIRPKATEGPGSWTLLTLPKTASAKLPSRDMTMVEGTINGFPFRAALEPNGKGSHWLRVNRTMRDAAGADAVDTVTVEIARAGEEPEIRVPMDLRKALAAAPLAQAGWEDITPMARRDWIFSISSAKQPETRRRRIEKACDMLASGKRRLCCFPGVKWLMKKKRKIMRNVASVAELRKSFFAGIDKIETREDLEDLRLNFLAARREFPRQFCVHLASWSVSQYCAKLHQANNERFIFDYAQREV